MELSRLPIELECPTCGFTIDVLLQQLIAKETIICPGRLEEIHLVDEGGSSRRAEQQLNNELDQLRHLFDG
jgi:hypothetical protein